MNKFERCVVLPAGHLQPAGFVWNLQIQLVLAFREAEPKAIGKSGGWHQTTQLIQSMTIKYMKMAINRGLLLCV